MSPLQTNVNNAETIVKATICLHNFLRQTNCAAYCPSGFVDSWDDNREIREGEWRRLIIDSNNSLLNDLPPIRGSRPKTNAVNVRNNLKSYVNSMEGSLSWQWEHVQRESKTRRRVNNFII